MDPILDEDGIEPNPPVWLLGKSGYQPSTSAVSRLQIHSAAEELIKQLDKGRERAAGSGKEDEDAGDSKPN